MNIIAVAPLARTKGVSELSYFTAAEVPIGAIVSVPIRSKNVPALVISSRSVTDVKSEIRSASYTLRKLGRVNATTFFPPSFVHACRTIADYYVADIGSVIDTLTSDALIGQISRIATPVRDDIASDLPTGNTPATTDETYAIQGDDDDRMSAWRSLIRQEFARKRSVAIYAPTIEDIRSIAATLTKGIEGYLFMLHSKMTKKQTVETWNTIAATKHPIVVVATGSFAALPRTDIDTVVIERENGRGWVSQKHPYIDLRHAIETIARARGCAVYRADTILRTETLHRVDEHDISTGSPFKWRSISPATDVLIDMKKGAQPITAALTPDQAAEPSTEPTNDEQRLAGTHPFRVLSKDLEDLIRYNQAESTHLFILAIRRGMSPTTVCSDCETIVSCSNCSNPVVLHTSKESGKNFFMCHRCGERRSAHETCAVCGGWRLTPLGIGIDKVYEAIREHFTDIDVFKIDADTTTTDTKIAETIASFQSKPGSILLGTEMALSHLVDKIEHVAVASIDSLFALPDFRIPEKAMHLLVRLRSRAIRSFLVQTRKPEEPVFAYALKGNLSDFHRHTIDERTTLSYPPFSTLIKITIEGKKEAIAERMAEVQRMLEPREIDIFPAFTATVRGNSIIHGLLKLPRGGWPNSDLLAKLRLLPLDVKVKVDPESLL